MSVTIYHNPRCSKSRQTLALLEEKGIVSREELRQLLELAAPVQVSQSVTTNSALVSPADPT